MEKFRIWSRSTVMKSDLARNAKKRKAEMNVGKQVCRNLLHSTDKLIDIARFLPEIPTVFFVLRKRL